MTGKWLNNCLSWLMIDTKWSVIFRSFSKLTISKCSYFTLFVVKLSTLRVDFLQPWIVDLFRIFLSQVKTYLCLHNQYQGDRIWVQSWPQMTNLGLFQIRFQYILARWNMIWKFTDLSHLGSIWPTLGPNLVTMVPVKGFHLSSILSLI